MRSSKNRSRSKNRNRPSGGNVINRVFDSSGPEGKVRGTPQQIIDKYGQLARDAQLAGDRVAVENFQQHAEHYTRLLAEAQREVDAKREQQEREEQARRERQDRERAEREAKHAERQQERAEAQPAEAPAQEAPAEVAAPEAPPEAAGPVETPEDRAAEAAAEAQPPVADEKPKRPRRSRARKPRNDPREDAAETPPAAEA